MIANQIGESQDVAYCDEVLGRHRMKGLKYKNGKKSAPATRFREFSPEPHYIISQACWRARPALSLVQIDRAIPVGEEAGVAIVPALDNVQGNII